MALIFSAQTVLLPMAEASIWKERRDASLQSRKKTSQQLFASLPMSLNISGHKPATPYFKTPDSSKLWAQQGSTLT